MYQYPKNFLSVAQLIQKFLDAGMTIDSQDEAELAVRTIGYYRLKGYCFPADWESHVCFENQSF